jgi:hypothetical protein
MKAKACSLYDKMKLFRIKHGYTQTVNDMRQYEAELRELARNGYIKLGEFNTIRILK